jgi:hypothetical protein
MLPKGIHEVLIGSLLGDACMEKNGRFYRVKFDHAVKIRDYVEWKYDKIKTIAASFPKSLSVNDTRTGKTYHHVRFNTRCIPELEEYYRMFYPDHEKRVPSNIQEVLSSELSLAVWYMDDGHRRTDCRALRICTHAFDKAEISRLIDTIEKNFGIRSVMHRAGKTHNVIYIPGDNAKKFCNLIRCYILPCMEYKLL